MSDVCTLKVVGVRTRESIQTAIKSAGIWNDFVILGGTSADSTSLVTGVPREQRDQVISALVKGGLVVVNEPAWHF